MKYLILAMILSGSALMVVNIVLYGRFIKKNYELEKTTKLWLLIIPLLLLIFFLIGYVVVGLSGIADIMMSSILFGGSIFVFLLMRVIISIVGQIRETEQVLAARYDETKAAFEGFLKNAMSVFRVNLTKDEIEEMRGENLYETDYDSVKYTDLVSSRQKYILDPNYYETNVQLFSRDGLLKHYMDGQTQADQVVFEKDKNGNPVFVRYRAMLTKMPVSGDVIAFIVEEAFNEDVVKRMLIRRVLMEEYDMIGYIVNGNYKVLMSNVGKKEGLLFKDNEDDTYESIYYNVFLPQMIKDENPEQRQPNPLRMSVIEKNLKDSNYYKVNASFVIDGKERSKQFVFYNVESSSHFYLMLLSDTTEINEEQESRSRQLNEALEKSESSNESRVKFFTNINHDFSTSIHGILGYTELAQKEHDVEVIHSYLSGIAYSSKKLMSFMDDLLSMSKIESGGLKISKETVNIFDELSLLRNEIIENYAVKSVGFDVDCSGVEDRMVKCDCKMVKQILNRLVSNSMCFVPEGSGVSLSVQQKKTDDGCSDYIFRISNKGKKIADNIASNLFSAESWLNYGDSVDVPGAGIGMMVSKKYVDALGGTIELTSNEEDNIELTLVLPMETVCEDEKHGIIEKNIDFNQNLLVADDNEINREIAKLTLESVGFKVDLACDGNEAYEKVKASEPGQYAAVLMDVQMPVMNGYMATKAIRSIDNPILAGIPIIAMTANNYQEDKKEALDAGMNDFVTKPVNIDQIVEVLKKYL